MDSPREIPLPHEVHARLRALEQAVATLAKDVESLSDRILKVQEHLVYPKPAPPGKPR